MIIKVIPVIIITIFCLSTITGCSSKAAHIESSTFDSYEKVYQIGLNKDESTYDDNSVVGGYGGDEAELFYFPFNQNYNGILSPFYLYVGEEKYNEWKAQLNKVDFGNGNWVWDFNLRIFLDYFEISKEDFRQIYTFPYDEKYDIGYTDEMLDALYSNDMEALHKLFGNPYEIYHNGKVYTPAWIASHSYEDYVKEELPVELVLEMTETALRDNRFVADMKRVEAKVNAGLAAESSAAKNAE